jgi:hypothetical protein
VIKRYLEFEKKTSGVTLINERSISGTQEKEIFRIMTLSMAKDDINRGST